MNVFELMATLSLDTKEFSQGLDQAKGEAEQAGSGIGNGLATVAGVAGKAFLAAGAAAATGVATLAGAAVSSYGQYQQLMGGAELMFGDASQTVLDNAAMAYNTMALSQNEYLTQANMFATGLTNALEGDAQSAANLVNDIMQAEADVVAATGQDMELVQNAFNGIMRNNYMMLDNLGLGIKPTKEGMEEMIATVNEWNAAQGNATQYTIDNLADQEAALVDYIRMQGLSGYSSMEAGETITGSIGQVTAAWQNLVTGLADPNADLGVLISRMVTAARGAMKNLIPTITQALSGIAELVGEIAPLIEQELPTLIDDILPPLLSAAVSIVSALVASLPSILSALTGVIPMLLNTLIPAIIEMLPMLVEAALQLIVGLAEALAAAAPTLIPAVVQCVLLIAQKLSDPDMIALILDAGVQLFSGLLQGILESIPAIIEMAPLILEQLTLGLLSALPSFMASVTEMAGDVIQSLMGTLANSVTAFIELMHTFGAQLMEDWSRALEGIKGIFMAGWDFVREGVQGLKNHFGDILSDVVTNAVPTFVNDVISAFTGFFNNLMDQGSGFLDFFAGIWADLTSGFANLNLELPHIDLPHFSIQGTFSVDPPSIPTIGIEWYAKAYNQPRLLNGATIFGAAGGSLLGGGENGGELIVGWEQLKKELGASQPVQHIHVYVGGTEIDDFVVDSSQRNDFISGGRG